MLDFEIAGVTEGLRIRIFRGIIKLGIKILTACLALQPPINQAQHFASPLTLCLSTTSFPLFSRRVQFWCEIGMVKCLCWDAPFFSDGWGQCSELILAYNLVSCQAMMGSQWSTPHTPIKIFDRFLCFSDPLLPPPPSMAQAGLTGALLHRFRFIFNSNNSSDSDLAVLIVKNRSICCSDDWLILIIDSKHVLRTWKH